MSLNLLALWDVMGNVARGVVVLLLGMSVFSFTVALERLFAFRRARRQSQLFARQVGRLLDEDRVEETIALARSWSHSHLAKLVAAGLVEYERKSRLVDLSTDDALASARRAAERAMLSALSDFKRGTGGLATIGATAPFVGLFGTVIGIINAFAEMGKAGAGGVTTVANGIAEALVTTALGLLVALPAVWLYNYLLQRVERFQVEMSNSASELVDRLIELDHARSLRAA